MNKSTSKFLAIVLMAMAATGIALIAVGQAWAVDVPVGSRYDARIQYVNYNPSDVVLVRTLPGIGSRIVFAPGERVLSAGSGFTQGWEIQASNNELYIKPRSVSAGSEASLPPEAGTWDTNLMVTTDQRIYDFELQLLEGSNSGAAPRDQRAAYRVEFRYPAEAQAQADHEAQRRLAEARMSAKPSPVNWHYSMQVGRRSSGIAPALAYDDGRFTYLRFPANRDFPTAFIVAEDRSESIIDSHIDPQAPDILVIHRVSRSMVLRLGSQVVGIYNERFDPDGIAPIDGTTVPGVRRVLIGEDGQ